MFVQPLNRKSTNTLSKMSTKQDGEEGIKVEKKGCMLKEGKISWPELIGKWMELNTEQS